MGIAKFILLISFVCYSFISAVEWIWSHLMVGLNWGSMKEVRQKRKETSMFESSIVFQEMN